MGPLYLLAALRGCFPDVDGHLALAAVTLAPREPEVAWTLCARMDDPDLRGDCKVAVTTHRPDPVNSDCRGLRSPHWRAECAFVRAERLVEEGAWDAAIEGCTHAEPWSDDCARHLWDVALMRGTKAPADFRARLLAAVPDADLDLVADTTPVAERAAALADQESARVALLARTAVARQRGAVSLAACPSGLSTDACLVAAADVLADRWHAAVARDRAVLAELCGEGQPRLRRLAWDPGPLDATAAALRAELCP